MTPEIISLIGGGVAGFVFRLIGSLVDAQQANVAALLSRQGAADDSADRAQARGGVWVRRGFGTQLRLLGNPGVWNSSWANR